MPKIKKRKEKKRKEKKRKNYMKTRVSIAADNIEGKDLSTFQSVYDDNNKYMCNFRRKVRFR